MEPSLAGAGAPAAAGGAACAAGTAAAGPAGGSAPLFIPDHAAERGRDQQEHREGDDQRGKIGVHPCEHWESLLSGAAGRQPHTLY